MDQGFKWLTQVIVLKKQFIVVNDLLVVYFVHGCIFWQNNFHVIYFAFCIYIYSLYMANVCHL